MKTVKELNRIFPFDFVYKDNLLYYAAYNLNGIFAFDMEKKENRLLTYIPDEYVMGGGGYYSGAGVIGDELLIVPDHASSFVNYNLRTRELKKLSLPKTKAFYPVFSKFRSVIENDKSFFCIPIRYPGLVEIDEGGNVMLHECDITRQKDVLIMADCILDNRIYMMVWNYESKGMEELLVFQTETQKFENMKVGYGKIYHICANGKGLWLVTEKGLVFWDIKENKMKSYELPQELKEIKSIIKIICFENKVWLFAGDGTLYTCFSIEKEKYSNVIYVSDRICHTYILNNYISIKVYDSKLFYFNASTGKLSVFFDGIKKEYELNIPEEYSRDKVLKLDKLYQNAINEGAVLDSWGKIFELKDYIKYVSPYKKKREGEIEKNIGQAVFAKIKENMR